MMCHKSFAILFLMLSTTSSEVYPGLFGPNSNVGPSQSSSASSASTASAPSEDQIYNYANTAFRPSLYSIQQSYGQSGALSNGFNYNGLKNQPEEKIIKSPPGVPDTAEPSSPQDGAGPSWSLNNAPFNFPELPLNFPQDSIASTWTMPGSTENSPDVSSSLPKWISEGFPGYSPGFTTYSLDHSGQSQEPGPVPDPLSPPPLVDLPDIPAGPDLYPVENAPASGASLPESPSSGFPYTPVIGGIPALFDDSTGLSTSTFDNWAGTVIDNSAGSSSSQSSDTGSETNFPGNDGCSDCDEDYDYGMGYDYIYPEDEDEDNDVDLYDETGDADINGIGFGGGIIPCPIANQWNFFPGPFWRCRNYKKSSEDNEGSRDCGNYGKHFRCGLGFPFQRCCCCC